MSLVSYLPPSARTYAVATRTERAFCLGPNCAAVSDSLKGSARHSVLTVSSDLKWTDRVNAIASNAASRVHFLKRLKRAGIPTKDLLHLYTAIVGPVLEYACPVWHYALTAGQCNTIENIQKRAIRMIYSESDNDYETALIVASMDSLKDRRETLMVRFLRSRSWPEMPYSTTYYLNDVIMTLSVA